MNNVIKNVVDDLDKHIENEYGVDDMNKPRRYYYDRMEWIRINKSHRDDLYGVGLENLRVLIYQLGLFRRHILTDENGKEIEQIITER